MNQLDKNILTNFEYIYYLCYVLKYALEKFDSKQSICFVKAMLIFLIDSKEIFFKEILTLKEFKENTKNYSFQLERRIQDLIIQ